MVGRSFTACLRGRSILRVAPRRDGGTGTIHPALKGRATFFRRSAAGLSRGKRISAPILSRFLFSRLSTRDSSTPRLFFPFSPFPLPSLHPPHMHGLTAKDLIPLKQLLLPRLSLGPIKYNQVPFVRSTAVHILPRLFDTFYKCLC
jgi:hypothetical protein